MKVDQGKKIAMPIGEEFQKRAPSRTIGQTQRGKNSISSVGPMSRRGREVSSEAATKVKASQEGREEGTGDCPLS